MKGQLDKEAIVNPIVEANSDQLHNTSDNNNVNDDDDDENVIEWSPEMLKKRSRELQLVDANGVCKTIKHDIGKRCDSRIDELTFSENDEESKSPSRSTTSDSQVNLLYFFLIFNSLLINPIIDI